VGSTVAKQSVPSTRVSQNNFAHAQTFQSWPMPIFGFLMGAMKAYVAH
jgi:hypothetical protein